MTTEEPTPLEREIRARIAKTGPIPVTEFMALCLYDPRHGYYNRRTPFGAAGDFITAPEISQMFGELIGLWAADVWQSMGAPDEVALIELGPGRGTMMKDALRAARAAPEFRKAARAHLIETSLGLQSAQRRTLSGVDDVPLRWHGSIDDVPAVPSIIVANEFFDALPIRQAERRSTGWHERMVAVEPSGALMLTIAPNPLPDLESKLPPNAAHARIGAVFEWRPQQHEIAIKIACRAAATGAALIIDYGHLKSATGDTFQAVRSHRYANPLTSPGLADLTAHVDFEALSKAAQQAGARVHGPIEQGTWLKRLGIEARAAVLQAKASSSQRADIAAAVPRLAGTGPDQMGSLFKAIGFSAPAIVELPGFTP
jgi:NADH dehydrogenase [ubiquinone] 1 alpha subcomplex assembly factor 7